MLIIGTVCDTSEHFSNLRGMSPHNLGGFNKIPSLRKKNSPANKGWWTTTIQPVRKRKYLDLLVNSESSTSSTSTQMFQLLCFWGVVLERPLPGGTVFIYILSFKTASCTYFCQNRWLLLSVYGKGSSKRMASGWGWGLVLSCFQNAPVAHKGSCESLF